MTRSSFVAVAASAVVLASCTSKGASTEPSPPAAAPQVAAPPAGGFVSATVSSFASAGSPTRLSTTAAFWDDGRAGCTQRAAGECTVHVCAAEGATARSPTSGDVRLEIGGAPLLLSADGNGSYANPAPEHASWTPSTKVRFASAGAEVPAFDVTLEAPSPLRVLEPDSHGAAVVDRAAGWSARWEPGEGAVRVAVRQENTPGAVALQGGVAVDCFYDRSAGEAKIPAAALSDLSPDEANVMVFATQQTRVQAGRYDIMVLVNTGGIFQRATVR